MHNDFKFQYHTERVTISEGETMIDAIQSAVNKIKIASSISGVKYDIVQIVTRKDFIVAYYTEKLTIN